MSGPGDRIVVCLGIWKRESVFLQPLNSNTKDIEKEYWKGNDNNQTNFKQPNIRVNHLEIICKNISIKDYSFNLGEVST